MKYIEFIDIFWSKVSFNAYKMLYCFQQYEKYIEVWEVGSLTGKPGYFNLVSRWFFTIVFLYLLHFQIRLPASQFLYAVNLKRFLFLVFKILNLINKMNKATQKPNRKLYFPLYMFFTKVIDYLLHNLKILMLLYCVQAT